MKLVRVLIIVFAFFIIGCGTMKQYKYPIGDVNQVYEIFHYDSTSVQLMNTYYSFMYPVHWYLTDTTIVIYFQDIRGRDYYFERGSIYIKVITESEISVYKEDIELYYTK